MQPATPGHISPQKQKKNYVLQKENEAIIIALWHYFPDN